jgi:uncharacterized protein
MLIGIVLAACGSPQGSFALTGEPVAEVRLDAGQSAAFRAWMVRLIDEQIRQGPNPRWFHRDCAGLVRFAVNEAFKVHDAKWLRVNAMSNLPLPPDLHLRSEQQSLRRGWTQLDGTRAAFATAQVLVQRNARFVSKDLNQALPADFLFFDQGDDQHLMVWMNRYIAYHTGTETRTDNGLRAVTIKQLMQWKDTRWRPEPNNPNFIGVFRLAFLSH